MPGRIPKVVAMDVVADVDYEDNVIDILTDTGRKAVYASITNNGSSILRVKLNGRSDAIFTLDPSEFREFAFGTLLISKLEFLNTVSGGADCAIEVLYTY